MKLDQRSLSLCFRALQVGSRLIVGYVLLHGNTWIAKPSVQVSRVIRRVHEIAVGSRLRHLPLRLFAVAAFDVYHRHPLLVVFDTERGFH